MKKNVKNWLIAGIVILLSAVTISGCMAVLPKADMKPSDYDLGLTYDDAVKQDKPILAVFYVDWCTYCKRFMPRLDKVRNINKNDINVVLINAENPKNEALVKKYRIAAYPYVYIIDPSYDYKSHIDGPFLETVSDLSGEVNKYKNLRNLIKKGDSCK